MNLDGLTEEQKLSIVTLKEFQIHYIQNRVNKYREENAKAAKPKYKFVQRWVYSSFFEDPRGYWARDIKDADDDLKVYIFDRERLLKLLQACSCSIIIKFEDFLDAYLAKETE